METCSIVPVTTYIGSAGISGAMHNLFAAKVNWKFPSSSQGTLSTSNIESSRMVLGDGDLC